LARELVHRMGSVPKSRCDQASGERGRLVKGILALGSGGLPAGYFGPVVSERGDRRVGTLGLFVLGRLSVAMARPSWAVSLSSVRVPTMKLTRPDRLPGCLPQQSDPAWRG
jgi:hypothetical protein